MPSKLWSLGANLVLYVHVSVQYSVHCVWVLSFARQSEKLKSTIHNPQSSDIDPKIWAVQSDHHWFTKTWYCVIMYTSWQMAHSTATMKEALVNTLKYLGYQCTNIHPWQQKHQRVSLPYLHTYLTHTHSVHRETTRPWHQIITYKHCLGSKDRIMH